MSLDKFLHCNLVIKGQISLHTLSSEKISDKKLTDAIHFTWVIRDFEKVVSVLDLGCTSATQFVDLHFPDSWLEIDETMLNLKELLILHIIRAFEFLLLVSSLNDEAFNM